MNGNFVLHGNICYSVSPSQLATVPDGYLVCIGGLSKGVFTSLPSQYAHLPVKNYGDALIIPGLCDLHVHAPQYSFRALGMDLELLDWLNTHTFPEEAKYKDIGYAEKAYSVFVQDVLHGPNTRCVVFGTVHVPATLLLMDKFEESGLISMVGKVNMDRNTPPTLQEDSANTSLKNTLEWLKETQGRYKRTSPILTPRFIPSCSDDVMNGLAEIQKEYSLGVQSHLSENPSEVDWVKQLCPTASGYADAYMQYGLLGGKVPTIMAHCVWLRLDEIDLLAQRGVYVAHCPQSNQNLSSGIAPVRKFLNKGVPVGLGSDVAGGCHTSIFRAMADAIGASKMYWRYVDQSDKPISMEEAFYLGSMGGGAFFGLVGSFLEGYELDALVIDDSDIAKNYELTLKERLERVVYLSDNSHITAKYVQGRQLF